MEKEKLEEYRDYVKMKYDNLLVLQEGVGISYGELAYIDKLTYEQLQEFENEIDNQTYLIEVMERE